MTATAPIETNEGSKMAIKKNSTRKYAAVALGYLALVFGWFALTALRGEPSRFVFGAAVTGLGVLGALHVVNPDALILRHNLARDGGQAIDARYATSVSPDAAAELQMVCERVAGANAPAAGLEHRPRRRGGAFDPRSFRRRGHPPTRPGRRRRRSSQLVLRDPR